VDYAIDASSSGVGAPARPPVASFVVAEDEVPQPSRAARLFGAPGWVFHLACGVGTLGIVWAASSPAGLDLTGDPFAWLGVACAVVWALRLIAAVSLRTLTTAFLMGPLMAGALAGVVYLEVPQETRWVQAQSGFEKAVRELPTAKDWDQARADEVTPGRIGSYSLQGVSRDAAGAAQFHLADGVAFTYLVDGPTTAVKDANPGAAFEHLRGHWYVLHP
jgi:hypothetical protein